MTDVTPAQQAGYDAVYARIRRLGGDAHLNAVIWRAVEAYRNAANEYQAGLADGIARAHAAVAATEPTGVHDIDRALEAIQEAGKC